MQKGSLVGPDRLRFDFTHDAPLSREEIDRIEDLVNGWIESNIDGQTREMSYTDAIAAGAIAIFEEKYGDRVRVVSFGEASTELCGGTHAGATGDIGLLKIVSESGIASGVRRIEALTGRGALRHIREQENTLRRAAALLKVAPNEIPERIEKLVEDRRAAEREIEALQAKKRGAASSDLSAAAKEIGDVRFLAARVEGAQGKELRSMVDDLRGQLKRAVVLLAAEADGRVSLALGVTKDLTDRFPAGALIREVVEIVGGKGGGRPDFAQGGGDDPAKLDAAFARLETLIAEG
jgi:alanyl-tRNA synthetase